VSGGIGAAATEVLTQTSLLSYLVSLFRFDPVQSPRQQET
jgi:hypothetical protein